MVADLGDFLSLSYGEVKRSVHALPDEAIAELTKGPLPDLKHGGYTGGEDCRVCQALKPLDDEGGPAAALLEWHDFVSKTFVMVRQIADSDLGEGDEDRLTDECLAMIGGLSYARCTTIYALAEAEAGVRRRRLEAARA